MSENCGLIDVYVDYDDFYGGMGCVEVIVEVWILFDGECILEICERLW